MSVPTIPPDLTFADLALELAPDGGLRYLPSPLGEFCVRNGIDPEAVTSDEDQACAVIAEWYVLHREAGGTKDATAEAILDRLLKAR